jgi:uncharacterized protein (DUF488 family)
MTCISGHSASARHAFCAIGHSHRSIDAFIALIKGADIDLVADVRTVPRSRAQPQFNAEALAHFCASCRLTIGSAGMGKVPAIQTGTFGDGLHPIFEAQAKEYRGWMH